ncbi:MAG: metal ABC transporter permease [Deltaproteobacteria bacterium]|nr:metal ABC transporter permease [Deltaproteobacteria bacterium]
MDAAALSLLAMPLVACLILVGILAYLGIHVLARGVVFVDLALAQVAALGTTVAFLTGHRLDGAVAYSYSLGFTFGAAGLFALSRRLRARVPQEAMIGVAYVVAAAAAIVFVDKAPHGAEHLKYILVGNILWVSAAEVLLLAVVCSAVGVFHFVFRNQLLALSFDRDVADARTLRAVAWDLAFYASFGVVITTSVQLAGVLLVFACLIVPAVFAALFATRVAWRLVLSWALGFLVAVTGILASYFLDLPTGAAVVATFGLALLLALAVRVLWRRRAPAMAEG